MARDHVPERHVARTWALAMCRIATVTVVLGTAAIARAQVSQEYALKAQALYNFLLFVDWPDDAFPNPAAPIRLCVLDADDFAQTLDSVVANRQVKGRSVTVSRLKRLDVDGCHALFVPGPASEELRQIAASKNVEVLTVGDTVECVRKGAIIGFYTDRNRLRFEINPEAAAAAKLKISSKLLGMARVSPAAVKP